MQIIKNLEQQSEEWFKIRSTRMTGSNAAAIGNKGPGLKTYIYKKVQEEFSTKPKIHFTNKHTDRGNELEPVARAIYELKTGYEVEEVGICIIDDYLSVSPDGLISKERGSLEIKCHDDPEHFRIIQEVKELKKKDQPLWMAIKKSYRWQDQFLMEYMNLDWCDHVSYNQNFDQDIIIIRMFPDQKMIEEIKEGVEKGKQLMIKLRENMNV